MYHGNTHLKNLNTSVMVLKNKTPTRYSLRYYKHYKSLSSE